MHSNKQYPGLYQVDSPDSPSCTIEAWAPTGQEWGEIVRFVYRQDLIGASTLKSPFRVLTPGKPSPGRQPLHLKKITQGSPSNQGVFSMDDDVDSGPVIIRSPKPRRWLIFKTGGPRSPNGGQNPVSWQSAPTTKVSLHTIVAEQRRDNEDQPRPCQSKPTHTGPGNRILTFSPPRSTPLEPLVPRPHLSSQRQRRRQRQQQTHSRRASVESPKTIWSRTAQPEVSESGSSSIVSSILRTRKEESPRLQSDSSKTPPGLPAVSSLTIIQEEQAAENQRVEEKVQRVVQKGLSSIQREELARFEIGQYYILHGNAGAGEWFVLQ
ncbi:hypothetical protein IWQ61_007829 [Dispira simplex]|nr:hypothetical protein IWQ61_007829 [Dispira simplex]